MKKFQKQPLKNNSRNNKIAIIVKVLPPKNQNANNPKLINTNDFSFFDL